MLFVLFQKIALAEVTALLAHSVGQWPLLLIALMLPALGLLIAGLRWKVLLVAQGSKAFIGRLVEALLVGSFFNQFLPSTIGGDFVRSRWLAKSSGSALLSLTVVGLDRVLGSLGICAVALMALATGPAMVRSISDFWLVLATLAFGTITVVLFASVTVSPALRRLLPIQTLSALESKVRLIYRALAVYRRHKGHLLLAFLLSVGLQLTIIVQYLALAAAFGLDVSVWEFSVVVSVATLVSLMPVTINGIGLRENALAVLGAPLGVSASNAVALGGAFMVILLVYGFVGGIIYLNDRIASKTIP